MTTSPHNPTRAYDPGIRDGGSPSWLSAALAHDACQEGEYLATRAPSHWRPEQALCAALIEQAALELSRGAVDPNQARHTWHWVLGEPLAVKSAPDRFTFAQACESVGVSAQAARSYFLASYQIPPRRAEPAQPSRVTRHHGPRVDQWVRTRTGAWYLWQLATALDVRADIVTRHVRRLERAGLVLKLKRGQYVTLSVACTA